MAVGRGGEEEERRAFLWFFEGIFTGLLFINHNFVRKVCRFRLQKGPWAKDRVLLPSECIQRGLRKRKRLLPEQKTSCVAADTYPVRGGHETHFRDRESVIFCRSIREQTEKKQPDTFTHNQNERNAESPAIPNHLECTVIQIGTDTITALDEGTCNRPRYTEAIFIS